MKYALRFGDTVLRIEGNDHLVRGVYEELSEMVVKVDNEDVIIDVGSSAKRNISNENYYFFNPHPNTKLYPTYFMYIPKNMHKPLHILINAKESKFHYAPHNAWDYIVDKIWKIYDRTWLSLENTFTYVLINGVIEPIVLFFFPEKSPIVHASGLSYKNNGVIISGMGGVGKTTTLLKLLLRERYLFYITDDKAILDSQGNIIFYPRKMMVYEYNLKDIPELKEKFKKTQDIWDKIHWYIHSSKDKSKMRRRRLTPEGLFGKDKVNKGKVPLRLVFFLQKVKTQGIKFEDMDYEEYSGIMGNIMKDSEFERFSRFIFKSNLLDMDAWKERYIKALVSRFKNTHTRIIKVKLPTSSIDYKKLEERIIENLKDLD